MLDYGFWWDVAHYGNEAWKGKFTEREVAQNAYEYLCAWLYSLQTDKVSETIKVLINNLKQDKETLEYLVTTMESQWTLRKVNEYIETIESEIECEGLEV